MGGVVVVVSVVVLVVVCDDQLSGRPTARLVWFCLSTVADTSKCGNFWCLANSGLLRAVLAKFMRNRAKDLNHGGEHPASYILSASLSEGQRVVLSSCGRNKVTQLRKQDNADISAARTNAFLSPSLTKVCSSISLFLAGLVAPRAREDLAVGKKMARTDAQRAALFLRDLHVHVAVAL